MLRRVLLTVSLAALALTGAASATLVGGRGAPPDPTVPSLVATTAHAATTAAATTAQAATVQATIGASPVPTAAPSAAPATVVISGHGWGHGLGMSQWGAYGYAQHGWSYDRILAHYYQGTTLEQQPGQTVRVLLADGAAKVTLGSAAPFSVTDAHGVKVALPAGSLALDTTLAVAGKRKHKKLAPPLAFAAGKEPLTLAGKPYRGRLLVFSAKKLLQVVNALSLDQYVAGVVGNEMPSNWPAGALEAQAVAARTYALASLTNVVTASTYDLYPDTRDQVYGGIDAESSAVTSAVEATARRVLLSGGKVITAYYSSSSGGRTASAEEALGRAVPYLVSVPDPYDAFSPNHDWGPLVFDARKLAKTMKVAGGLLDLVATPGPSGHVATVTAVGQAGEQTITGAALRTLLGLRSTFFTIGWLSLDPAPSAGYGVGTTLTGIARGVGAVTVEGKAPGGAWQTVATVAPDAKGSFQVVVKPESTTQYRLAAGDLRASLVSVPVEPVVDVSVNAGAVSGFVHPPLPGAAVQLQRQSGATWATVATARPDVSGSYAVAAAVAPGSYRVRFAPGRGLAPGVSQIVAVR